MFMNTHLYLMGFIFYYLIPNHCLTCGWPITSESVSTALSKAASPVHPFRLSSLYFSLFVVSCEALVQSDYTRFASSHQGNPCTQINRIFWCRKTCFCYFYWIIAATRCTIEKGLSINYARKQFARRGLWNIGGISGLSSVHSHNVCWLMAHTCRWIYGALNKGVSTLELSSGRCSNRSDIKLTYGALNKGLSILWSWTAYNVHRDRPLNWPIALRRLWYLPIRCETFAPLHLFNYFVYDPCWYMYQ